MKRKTKFSFPAKYLLMILSVLCVGTCILSFTNVPFAANLKDVTGYVLIPVQKGLNQVGLWFSNKARITVCHGGKSGIERAIKSAYGRK